MPSCEGRYVGTRRTHDSIRNYFPFPSNIERTVPDHHVFAEITAAEKRFRTEAITGQPSDLNETPHIETPVELGRLGMKAVIGPGAYGRSDQPRRANDEALEGSNDDHAETCDCDLCRADRAAATKDGKNIAIVRLNRRNRKAFGQA